MSFRPSSSTPSPKRFKSEEGLNRIQRKTIHEALTDRYVREQFAREDKPSTMAVPSQYNPYFFGGERSLSDTVHARSDRSMHSPSIHDIRGLTISPLPRFSQNIAIERRRQAAFNDHYFIALDLDECSVLGNDTNDVLRTAFHILDYHKQKNFGQIPEERINTLIIELCLQLVNPSMVQAIQKIKDNIGYMPYIFAYTNKGSSAKIFQNNMKRWTQLLSRCMSNQTISNTEKENAKQEHEQGWKNHIHKKHPDDFWVFFEGSSPDKDYNYLSDTLHEFNMPTLVKIAKIESPGVVEDLESTAKRELRRIGCATWAMSKALGLDYNIPVFVSHQLYKNLSELCPVLGLASMDKLFLFDDKANEHFANMSLYNPGNCWSGPNDVHMIPVAPFDTPSLSPAARTRIKQILNEIDPRGAILSRNQRILEDISQHSLSWARHKVLYDFIGHQYKMGGADEIHRMAGSGPPLYPWDTSLFTQSGNPIIQRAKTCAQFQ